MENLSNNAPRRKRRTALFLGGIAVCVAIVAIFATRSQEPPAPLAPVIILPLSYTNSSRRAPLFNQIVPAKQSLAWLWHVKEAICGKPRSIQIDTMVVKLSRTEPIPFGDPAVSQAASQNGPGFRIWLFPQDELSRLRPQEISAAPRITTADDSEARLFVGSTLPSTPYEIGTRLTCRARIRGETLDLTTFVTNVTLTTQGSETNLIAKGRFQIPKGKGVLILQSPRDSKSPSPMGVIITTKF